MPQDLVVINLDQLRIEGLVNSPLKRPLGAAKTHAYVMQALV
jgi:hypothetical protein